MSIDLLGRFAVRLGERVVLDDSWHRGKAKAVLKLLALQPDRAIQRDLLLDILWPELTPAAAANNLRKNLSLLKSKLAVAGAELPIERSRDDVLTLPASVNVDLDELRSLDKNAATCACGPAKREAALSPYTGALLPQDRYEDWAEEAREAITELQVELLQDLCERARPAGETVIAERAARRIIELQPLHEDAYRELMRLYADGGNLGSAAYQYRRCRTTLHEQLGIEPSEETEAFSREIATRIEEEPVPPCPEVKYTTTSDGVKIAYWTLGDGTPLVYPPHIPYSSIVAEWNVPPWRDLFLRLAGPGRMVVRYDGRGTGSSDRAFHDVSLESHLTDLDAVLSALEIDRFAFFADRHSGVVALAFAAQHPEKVSRLVLWSGYANGREFGASPRIKGFMAILENDFDLLPDMVAELNLGTSTDANPAEVRPRIADFVRASFTQEQALALCYDHMNTDVTELLPCVEAPVLMFHRLANRDHIPDKLVQEAVDRLPHCDLILRDVEGPHPMQGDIEAEQAIIDEFLAES